MIIGMKNAIILHGKPSKEEYYDPGMPSPSNSHWIPWVQAQLLKNDIATQTPEIPLAYEPEWDLWCKEIDRFEITADTLLVGHSCGGGFWVRYLSERPDIIVGKVVLIAPSFGYRWEDQGTHFFENFKIDPELASRTEKIVIFNSSDDNEYIHQTVEEIQESIARVIKKDFKYGHFTSQSMGKTDFPELIDELLS